MKLFVHSLLAMLADSFANIVTEYKYLQQDGYVSELDMFHCQLRSNGNATMCAVRFDTRTAPSGALDERERCEQLDLDWCRTRSLESGYTYAGKLVVTHTPPYTFYHYQGGSWTWEIWENIPLAIEPGSSISISFTPSLSPWHKLRMSFINEWEVTIYRTFLYPSNVVEFMGYSSGVWHPTHYGSETSTISSGVASVVMAAFMENDIYLFVNGQHHITYSYYEPASEIRILQFVFYDYKGDINRVSYKAVPW